MYNTNMTEVILNNGIPMPILGLGVYDMYAQEAEQAVEDALEIGYRLIDTAAMYDNEKEIGNAVARSGLKRDGIFVTTKLNNTDHGFDQALTAFDASLEKLQMDYVDLYLIHWPIKENRKGSWLALERLYAEKRVRAIGVANYNIALLEELSTYANCIPAVNQIEFSPWLYQSDLLRYCKEKGIQVQSYSPLTRGIKFNDPRLTAVCEKYGKTPAQVVLNWHMRHGISTIPKSVKKQRLQENLNSASFLLEALDVEILDGLDESFRICNDPNEFL